MPQEHRKKTNFIGVHLQRRKSQKRVFQVTSIIWVLVGEIFVSQPLSIVVNETPFPHNFLQKSVYQKITKKTHYQHL